jgi:transposase
MGNVLATAEKRQETIEELYEKIAKLEALVLYYQEQLLNAKRRQFGTSSERVVDGQMSLFDDPEPAPPPEPETEEVTYRRRRRKGKREEDLSKLPVVKDDRELPEGGRGCPECGAEMRDIGASVRREIEIIPAQAVLKEIAVHAYACPSAECAEKTGKTVIVKAGAPAPLISGSLASPSLVAHIAVQKYANGMPLYRLEKGFEYDGVYVSRHNMSNWVIKCAFDYLMAPYRLMKSRLLEESVLHADETTVQVLREPGRPAQSSSYEWVYRTGGHSEHKIVIYEYRETRRQEHAREFLKGFEGFLHTDGYQAYHGLPPEIVVVGCWTHARRRWEKMYKNLPESARKGSDAEKGLAYIGGLFDLERKFKGLPPPERYERRLEKSKPIADAFFAWAGSLNALPKSPLGEAANYALSQREYLENVFLDGRLELSNNRCERSVKPFVMGRKAWLFSNTPEGAMASSVMYSIIETAKENGLHPFRYVKYLLETLPGMTSGEVEDVMPWSGKLPDECWAPSKAATKDG